MTKYDENKWQDSEPSNNDEWISKSQIKREAQGLKDFGAMLTKLSAVQLKKLPLDETLLDAILHAQNLKLDGSRRRQLQLIGKLLRARDNYDELEQALNALQNNTPKHRLLLQKTEKWREKLLAGDDVILDSFIQLYPDSERQHLRNLIRAAKKEQQNEKYARNYQQLFQYLKSIILPL